ncbi:MAG: hypothetical protein K5641_08435 [Lachnospiraceae bacterium]|nr:hypothetical protein [Lachnospiraceae bacterium]
MRKKYLLSVLLIFALVMGCAGCAGTQSENAKGAKTVDEVFANVDEARAPVDETPGTSETEADILTETEMPDGYAVQSSEQSLEDAMKSATEGEMIDLTDMGSDMVYATVFQMMREPSTYEGKKVRMEGVFSAAHFDETDSDYYFVIIADAMACCQQGMEFVWGDGSKKRADYPEEGTDVLVEGTFETYREAGDDTLYCHIKDASMKII